MASLLWSVMSQDVLRLHSEQQFYIAQAQSFSLFLRVCVRKRHLLCFRLRHGATDIMRGHISTLAKTRGVCSMRKQNGHSGAKEVCLSLSSFHLFLSFFFFILFSPHVSICLRSLLPSFDPLCFPFLSLALSSLLLWSRPALSPSSFGVVVLPPLSWVVVLLVPYLFVWCCFRLLLLAGATCCFFLDPPRKMAINGGEEDHSRGKEERQRRKGDRRQGQWKKGVGV